MKISDLLDTSNVLTGLSVKSKEEAITTLVQTLSTHLNEANVESALRAVMEREKIMSTGVGRGLAIPHGKSAELSRTYAAFAKLEEAVEYESIDGEPVHILFLLVGPESQNSVHIKMLSRISRLLNNTAFREKLVATDDSQRIIELFRSEEDHLVRI